MASVKKFKGSKYWYGCYNDVNGKRHQKSTKETNKAKALKIAVDWEDIAKRKITAQHLIRKNQEIASDAWGHAQQDVLCQGVSRTQAKRRGRGVHLAKL